MINKRVCKWAWVAAFALAGAAGCSSNETGAQQPDLQKYATYLCGGCGAQASNCWGTTFEYAADGSISCRVFEGTKMPQVAQCPVCESLSWRTTPPEAYLLSLQADSDFQDNSLACACEIPQAQTGDPLTACIESTDQVPTAGGQPVNGWCYVDPSARPGANGNLVAACPVEQKRTLRIVGEGIPGYGSLVFVTCTAETF